MIPIDYTDSDDKLFKNRPVVECVKETPEKYHSVEEQIIPSRTKCTKISQYNPKKTQNRVFNNLVWTGSSGSLYDFLLYAGKAVASAPGKYNHLQKSAQVVARLHEHLQANIE